MIVLPSLKCELPWDIAPSPLWEMAGVKGLRQDAPRLMRHLRTTYTTLVRHLRDTYATLVRHLIRS